MKAKVSEKTERRSKLREDGVISYSMCCFNCVYKGHSYNDDAETCVVHNINVLPDEVCSSHKSIFNI